ncbi:hypothetical protein [Shewanella sp.]|uniref:hypothetical protein n=1 Tax=Shewanella sp. TaxID=50422 RepID=UPI003A96C72E
MNVAQIYKKWDIPFILIGSGKVVPRSYAIRVIENIINDGFVLLGYDAFAVLADGKRCPVIDSDASFSRAHQPSAQDIGNSIKDDPPEISHYEFVFMAEE